MLELVVGVTRPLFRSSKFILRLTLCLGKSLDEALNPPDVCDMQVDLLQQDAFFLLLFDHQVVPLSVNLSVKLFEFLLCVLEELLLLFLDVKFPHFLHSDGLADFQIFELFPVILRFFNPTIDSSQFLFVLILLQLGNRLDFNDLHRSLEPVIQLHQLLLMLIFKRLQLLEPILLEVIQLLSPLIIEFLQSLLTNVLILLELTILDRHSQLLLIMRDVNLQ